MVWPCGNEESMWLEDWWLMDLHRQTTTPSANDAPTSGFQLKTPGLTTNHPAPKTHSMDIWLRHDPTCHLSSAYQKFQISSSCEHSIVPKRWLWYSAQAVGDTDWACVARSAHHKAKSCPLMNTVLFRSWLWYSAQAGQDKDWVCVAGWQGYSQL